MKKICMLTTVHTPSDSRIFYKESLTLNQEGYRVCLVAPCERDTVVEGVYIKAVQVPRGRTERMVRTVIQVYKKGVREGADLFHFHDPELLPVGMLLKARGKLVIYDVHEEAPKEILNKFWIPRRLRPVVSKAARLFEKLGCKIFDGIIAATPVIAKGFPSSKTVTVQNFPLRGELLLEKPSPYLERPPLVGYVGGITETRGIMEMVEAISHLPERLQARLVLAGQYFPPNLHLKLSSLGGWARVEYLGWLSRREVAGLLDRVRVGLVLDHPLPNRTEAQPRKLFEYMSAGIPVVVSDFPLWRKLVHDSNRCGLLVDPLDPKEIGRAVQWLLEHPEAAREMGREGYKAFLAHYNWDCERHKLLRFYKTLLRGRDVTIA